MNNLFKRPLNPLYIILGFTAIALIIAFLASDDPNALTYFFTVVGLGIYSASVQCAIISNDKQESQIKLELFDKRYQVLQSILDSITLVRRDNWDRLMLFNEKEYNINTQIIDIEERLYQVSHLSKHLFDCKLHEKICIINNAFCNVSKTYKITLVQNLSHLHQTDKLNMFIDLIRTYYLDSDENSSIKFEKKLSELFPEEYKNLNDFGKACNEYLELIDRTQILKEFDKYLSLRDIGI